MTLRVDVLHTQNTFRLQVAFEAPQGLTAICGHSGAGKTTLINLLAGTLTPSHGYIEINSRVLFNLKDRVNVPPERRNVGYIYQDARLFPHFSVKQNLESGRRFKKLDENPELFGYIVKLLGLESLLKRRPTKLSGGEQQRVAIGRALLSEPDFILADEPLASLDVGRRSEILPYFELLRDTMQIPILYVSHQNDEIERLATTRFEISAGQLVSPAD